jgi:peptide/nickel transport system substrate-binding protein
MSPLFYWEPTGEAKPVLAESYEFADDRRSLDVTLRAGIEFADGSPVDAEGVVASLEHLLSEDSAWPFKSVAEEAGATFSAVDPTTVRITFTEPVFHPDYYTGDIVRQLLFAFVLSPSGLADPDAAKAQPMSVGPYLVDNLEPEIEVTLVRNPDYWDPESYPFDTVVLKALPDPIAKLNALKSGQVDAAAIATEHIAEAESSGFRIQYGSPASWGLVVRDPVNSTLEPLRDVRVRQAIMLAFDREAIAETIDAGYGRASTQAFVEGQPEYVDGGDERYGYDPERARELLADAGYPDGFDVTIPIWGGTTSIEPIIQQSLGDIGIRVTFETTTDVLPAVFGGENPLTIWIVYSVNTLLVLSQEYTGIGRLFDQNDEIDRLMESINRGDAEESTAASGELGEKLLDEVWFIPIHRPPAAWGTAPGYSVDTSDTLGGPHWFYQFRVAED